MVKEYFLKTLHHWKILFKDRAFVWSFVFGVVVLISSIVVVSFVSAYHDNRVYPSLGDLILNEIPTYNLEFLFFWGIYAINLAIVLYMFFVEPEMAPFAMKTFGLLLFIRSGFLVLTFMGPPQGFYFQNGFQFGNILKDMFFINDLFFSGHTATPFLGFLIFRKKWWFRWFMLLSSLVMGVTVMVMHVHYSIDVFSAFFITYSIYALSNHIFNKLNLRFKERIRLYGWAALRKKAPIS